MALSALHATWRQIPAVEVFFYGLKPAVLAIAIGAVIRVGGKHGVVTLSGCAALGWVARMTFA